MRYPLWISILQFPIILCSVCEDNMKSGDGECSKNWAVVPYAPSDKNVLQIAEFDEEFRRFQFAGIDEDIVIKQKWNERGVAAVVWEAAIQLGKYFSRDINIKGKNIIELGSGTGLVGIVCSKIGANVTLTDMKESLPLLQENVELNFKTVGQVPVVQELKWGQYKEYSPCQYDYIIGADIVYIEDTFDDLLDTICFLSGCKGYEGKEICKKSVVLLSCKMRYSREMKFINRLKQYFEVERVFVDIKNDIHVYKAICI